ncbi:MAG TPA: AAA family ATPase [Bryobacteraceae bacterium]|nr:AAA family ATPase [Bryobacteraceae bacterium]
MAQVVIFIGLQGSGKTSYFKAHFAETHVHVSRDVLRTAEREAALVSECIRSDRSFVIDNTNTTRAVRAPLIQWAKDAGFEVHAYFFDTPVRTAIGRNNHRKDKSPLPVPAILRTAKYLQPPALDEGFDEIRTIPTEPDSSLSKP